MRGYLDLIHFQLPLILAYVTNRHRQLATSCGCQLSCDFQGLEYNASSVLVLYMACCLSCLALASLNPEFQTLCLVCLRFFFSSSYKSRWQKIIGLIICLILLFLKLKPSRRQASLVVMLDFFIFLFSVLVCFQFMSRQPC